MNISLQKKILGGFLFATLVSIVVGVVGWGSSTIIRGKMSEMGNVNVPSISEIAGIAANQRLVTCSLRILLNPTRTRPERIHEYGVIANNLEIGARHIATFGALPKSDEVNQLWGEFQEGWKAWQQDMEGALAISRNIDAIAIDNPQSLAIDAERAFGTYKTWAAEISKSLLEGTIPTVNEDVSSLDFGKWLLSLESENQDVQKAREKVLYELNLVLKAISSIAEFIEIEEPELAKDVYTAEVLPSVESIQYLVDDNLMAPINNALQLYDDLHDYDREKASVSSAQSQKLLDTIVEVVHEEVVSNLANGEKSSQKAQSVLLIVILVGSCISLALGVLISRNITQSIRRYIQELTGTSGGIEDISHTFTDSGQRLADDASTQAAALEETSASIEEIASMSRQNADNARQASTTMEDTKELLGTTNGHMADLTVSMEGITNASSETAKIVKTIDEIAFQTNLLALNAAVEAARAGEAGAGFAVVADEVRNLAMRAAEAAKNTAQLIDGTVSQVKSGSEMVEKTTDAFEKVSQRVQDASILVREITVASGDQAQGVEQVNKAITNIDTVTQQNAANADGYFRTSVKMESYAANLKEIVLAMGTMVGGGHLNVEDASATGYNMNIPLLTEDSNGVLNCWEFKNCGREAGGANAAEFGVCPAYPDHGHSCAEKAGTLCGGKIQGSFAEKIANCQNCEFYLSNNYSPDSQV